MDQEAEMLRRREALEIRLGEAPNLHSSNFRAGMHETTFTKEKSDSPLSKLGRQVLDAPFRRSTS